MTAGQGPSVGKRLRRLRLGLATLVGRRPAGWFIPYRHARPHRRPDYPALEPLFAAAVPAMAAVLADAGRLRSDLDRIPADGPGLRWRQSWFPRLDAAVAYTMVRRQRPQRIVEVGSGHSTRFLARAVRDGELSTDMLCIDPQPRASIAALPVRHLACLAEDCDAGAFSDLAPGDVLFIDSSHVAMPGSDVDRLLLDVLPRLPAGVLVHLHDIFLPDPYPDGWTWRGYNEQLVVAALLVGGAFEILWSSRYAATRMAQEVAAAAGAWPLLPDVFETSLWLRKARSLPGS